LRTSPGQAEAALRACIDFDLALATLRQRMFGPHLAPSVDTRRDRPTPISSQQPSMPSFRRMSVAVATVFVLARLALPIAAQDTPPRPAAAAPAASITVQEPKIDPANLRSQLRPMRKAEIEQGLEAWLGTLQAKAREVAATEVARRAAEAAGTNADVDRLSQQLVGLRAERDAIVERVRAVIEAAKDKGVDVQEATKYVESVGGGVQLEVTGLQSAWSESKAWLLSVDGGLRLLISIVQFVGVLIAFRVLGAILAGLLDRAVRRLKKTSDLLRDFVVNATRKLVSFVGIVIALSYIGVNIAPLVAAIGAAGFIVGFALQGTLQNFAAGIMVLIYRPYDIGDYVTAAGVSGTVASMNLVSTSIKTPDNQLIVVPNGSIWGGVITNVTANPTRRLDLKFGVSYTDDLDKVKAVLTEIFTSHPKVLKDPAPVIEVHELGDSSVNFVARPWINTSDYWKLHWEFHKTVKQRFDQEGISIPFPQRDVHLFQQPS
jgi:small conductance mechanosensitive channel